MDILKLDLNKAAPDAPDESEVRFQVSLLGALACVAAGFAARFIFDAPLVPELMAQFIFAVAPIWVVEIAVGMLGPFAKHLGFLACAVLYAIALIASGMLFLKRRRAKSQLPAGHLWFVAFTLLAWALTVMVIIPLLGGGLLGGHLRQGAWFTSASLFAVYAVYGAVLRAAAIVYIDGENSTRQRNIVSRRRIIRSVGYAVLALGVYDIGRSLFESWFQSGSGRVRGGSGVFPDVDGLALEVTPTRDFYEVSKNPFDPNVDSDRWTLEIGGLVNTQLSLSYEAIKNLPSVDQYATLACISNEVGGNLIGNATWRGVRLKDVLQLAGLKEGVVDIIFKAADDYRDSIPLERAMADATLLVYEMNGEPLTPTHGFPLRLIVPGIYGMKNVKWIKRIDAVGFDFKGYWQARGWDDRAEYKTMSRIDAPRSAATGATMIAGIAFAGDRGISKVEVSTDGGKTWELAEIKPALSPYSWSLWRKEWTPAEPGRHRVAVRATDGRGVTQTSQYAPPDPSGSSGYHSTTIKSE